MFSLRDGSNLPFRVKELNEKLRKLRTELLLLEVSLDYIHLYDYQSFNTYLQAQTIDGEGRITVTNVVFEATMNGFSIPDGCTKLAFSNCVAPPDMSGFFLKGHPTHGAVPTHGLTIADSLDLTGLNMSAVTNISYCFFDIQCKQLIITPTYPPPNGVILADAAFTYAVTDSITCGALFGENTLTMRYAFSGVIGKTVTSPTIAFTTEMKSSRDNNSQVGVDMYACFHYSQFSTLDLSKLHFRVYNAGSFFSITQSYLTTLDMSGMLNNCWDNERFFDRTNLSKLIIQTSWFINDSTNKKISIKAANGTIGYLNESSYSSLSIDDSVATITFR